MKSLSNRITISATTLIRAHHRWIAALMLVAMALLAGGSMVKNSATMDEVPHIAAGYSYDRYFDYRLNPEHPPLIKNLAGLPLLFMDLTFPIDGKYWKEQVNPQWDIGRELLYDLGNNADAILFWARIPILVIALGFGWFLYEFCPRKWGVGVGLLALFFYAFNPNFLAHSTLVTTDVAASATIFLVIVVFSRFIARPTRSNMLWLSLALALAMLVKFSAFLLYPLLGLAAVLVALTSGGRYFALAKQKLYAGGFLLASLLSTIWVLIYYAFLVIRMPVAVQDRLIDGLFVDSRARFMADFLMNLNDVIFMKVVVQYLMGLSLVVGRVSGGNVTYLNGEVINTSFAWYFPQSFLFKTPIAFLFLASVALAWALGIAWKKRKQLRALPRSFREHILEWLLGIFALIYFSVSVAGNLNLGIRHILPIYVPLFVLVAIALRRLSQKLTKKIRRFSLGLLAVLLAWYGAGSIANYPHYISYLNEFTGGQKNGYLYFTDSNMDWGQDLVRFKGYLEDHPEIERVALDYFGGGNPQYYFCEQRPDEARKAVLLDCSESKIELWWASKGPYPGQYIAVSETYLQNDPYFEVEQGYVGYGYLRAKEPIAKIGNTIYLYKLY